MDLTVWPNSHNPQTHSKSNQVNVTVVKVQIYICLDRDYKYLGLRFSQSPSSTWDTTL